MNAHDPPASKPDDDKPPGDRTRKAPAVPAPATKITPVDRKIGEGTGNLRDRANAFKRRRGKS